MVGVSADEFARLAVELYREDSVGETIDLVVAYAVQAVGCDHVSVMLVRPRKKVEPLATTDPLPEKLDRLQIEVGEGPALSAIWENHGTCEIPDTRLDTQWPRWSRPAAEMGIGSVLSLRLTTDHAPLGALSLLATRTNAFDEDDRAVADILARHASVAVDAARKEADLWRAIDARKRVGQAQGILMERFNLNADQAFAVLRRYSQDHNIKLNEVARLLLETRSLP